MMGYNNAFLYNIKLVDIGPLMYNATELKTELYMEQERQNCTWSRSLVEK